MFFKTLQPIRHNSHQRDRACSVEINKGKKTLIREIHSLMCNKEHQKALDLINSLPRKSKNKPQMKIFKNECLRALAEQKATAVFLNAIRETHKQKILAELTLLEEKTLTLSAVFSIYQQILADEPSLANDLKQEAKQQSDYLRELNDLTKNSPNWHQDSSKVLKVIKLYECLGRIDDAINLYKTQSDWTINGHALLAIAALEEKRGLFQNALDSYKLALKFLPTASEANLGCVRVRHLIKEKASLELAALQAQAMQELSQLYKETYAPMEKPARPQPMAPAAPNFSCQMFKPQASEPEFKQAPPNFKEAAEKAPIQWNYEDYPRMEY